MDNGRMEREQHFDDNERRDALMDSRPMTTQPEPPTTPRTEAGRTLFNRGSNNWSGADWIDRFRDGILAIEAEAAGAPEPRDTELRAASGEELSDYGQDDLSAAAAFMLELVDQYYGTDHEFDIPEEAEFRRHRAVIEGAAVPTFTADDYRLAAEQTTDIEIRRVATKDGDVLVIGPIPAPRTPPGTRLVLMTETLMDALATFTEDGRRITFEWGEPDEHGWYAPTFTVTGAVQDGLRALLVAEHRSVVGAFSGNFGGHVGIRDGWVEYDAETPIEDCDVCAALGEEPLGAAYLLERSLLAGHAMTPGEEPHGQ